MADAPKKKIAGPKKKARDEFQEEEIFQPPAITREPMSRQAKLGAKIVIRVTATGKPLPSFQWYHNGQKIVGATTDRLTLSKLRRQAAGSYHCEAKNFVGKATSRVAMLSFFTQEIPKLVIGPDNSRVEEGKPFTLKVLSPPAEQLRGFTVHWIFNGMRIKGATGPELNISAMKKKYDGEYKAMIATGGMLETSNVARLAMGAARPVPAAKPGNGPARSPRSRSVDLELESEGAILQMEGSNGSLSELPAQEPTRDRGPPAPAPAWEEFLFNPEDDEETAPPSPAAAPAPGSDLFGNTSPGTASSPSAPISQLKTQDLIREIVAQGGASDLIEKAKDEDVLTLGPESFAEPGSNMDETSRLLEAPPSAIARLDDPSGLIESLAPPSHEPAPAREDPSRLIEAPRADTATTDDPSGLIQALEQREPPAPLRPPVPHLREAPPLSPEALSPEAAASPPEKASPLSDKKRFLEGLLGRWQSKKPSRAA